jgi:DNA-binding SARP family transcriptional activator/tetratricopeptide (TPR) repeat protein
VTMCEMRLRRLEELTPAVHHVATVAGGRWRYVSITLPPDRMSERTRIQLCGRMSIELDGEEMVGRLRGRQVPLLLAYLLLHRERAIARDELADALWPDAAPRSQDAALRTLLSRLRSALGPAALRGRDELVLELPEPVWIDVEAAAGELRAALETLEHGDARAAWAHAQVPLVVAGRGLLPGAPAAWLQSPRRELGEVRLQALEIVGRAGLALGGNQLGSVERAGRSLLELAPYRESGYVLLMEALAAQGNVAEAVRVYERLRSLLRDELGTPPSQEAIAVHARLIGRGSGTPRPGLTPEADRSTNVIALPAALRARAAPRLVGRREELAAMRAWWSRDPVHPERMLLLAGEPGMGKTRLQAELAAEAHAAGAVVLAGHAPEETLVPYQPFLEAIGHFAFHAPVARLRAAMARSGESGPDIARLVPEIRRRLPDLPAARPGDPETDRYRLFEAIAGLFGELAAGGRLLVVLDDLHWGGRPTLLLLRHLVRSPQAAGLRILGAFRIGEAGAEQLTATIGPLRREGLVRPLEVGGLPRTDAAELVRLRAGGTPSSALQTALYDETEGNPFFLEELVRHLAESGVATQAAGLRELRRAGLPDDVRDLISRRLGRLSEAGLEWLRGAAVIGREFEAALLEPVLGVEEARFLDALEEALEARLVAESPGAPGHYAFSHALVRETLYAGISSVRRARTHHRVGLALEQRSQARAGRQPAGVVGALAHHFTRSGRPDDDERAITYGLAAGERATEMLANEEAAEHFARALEALERVDPDNRERRCAVLLELGEARVRCGERAGAAPALREAAQLAGELGDRGGFIRAALGASRRFIQPPGVVDEELIALLEQALELTTGEQTVDRVRLLVRLCAALYFSPRRADMRRLSAEATALAAQLADAEAAALAASARRRAWWIPDQLERRLADATTVLRCATESEDLELALQGHAWLVIDLLEAGDRAAAEAQIEAFAVGATSLGQPLFAWIALVWQTMLAVLDGRLAEADQLAEEAIAMGIRPEGVAATQYHLIHLLAIRREQLRSAELEAVGRQMLAGDQVRVTWRAGLALLMWDSGHPGLARDAFEALLDPDAAEVPRDGDWLASTALLAELAIELGDAERAEILYERLEPCAGSVIVFGVGVICWGSTARWLGRLALLTGRRPAALAHLERAVRVNAALRAPALLAHAQLDLATALGTGERASELVEAAEHATAVRQLPLVARRVGEARAALGAGRPLGCGAP